MKGRIFASLLAASILTLQGCLTGGSDDKDPDTHPDGTRKPNAPTVNYTTHDSLIHIGIRGGRAGEERYYWIYRDKELLEQPAYRSPFTGDTGWTVPGGYFLVDSVKKAGAYAYTVRYGSHRDSLSDPSTPYVFNWTGPSPSGRVRLYLGEGSGLVEVQHTASRSTFLRQVIIERRIGSKGETGALDTLDLGQFGQGIHLIDTNLVVDDVYLFYRSVGMDVDEQWLEPSPWDSILVRNKVWGYVPRITLADKGTDIQASISLPSNAVVTYYLYRNTTSSKDGKVKVDSLRSGANSSLILGDIPEKAGRYFYWVEAVDSHGRISARSNLVETSFTGLPKGPPISGLFTSSTSVQVLIESNLGARALILERASDTSKAATAVDTAYPGGSSQLTVLDVPPADGYWFYRLIAIGSDDRPGAPGDWVRSGYFHYAPNYIGMDARLVNRGDRIEIVIPSPAFDAFYVLFRSPHPGGKDSVAVDTVLPQQFSSLPPLVDRPEPGTWYYRAYGYRNQNPGSETYRSEIQRVEYSGKPVGPAITSISAGSTQITLYFGSDPMALAYILERTPGATTDWLAVDTLPPGFSETVTVSDQPPTAGSWRYRVRSIRKDMTTTEPGTASNSVPWSYQVTYVNSLTVNVINRGAMVEVREISPDFSYSLRLFRSAKSDYTGGIAVDTLNYGASVPYLTETPPKGMHYYWVERHFVGAGSVSSTVYRSVPVLVAFTGAPEVMSLSVSSSGISVGYPAVQGGDTLQILRSNGKPDDAASFAFIGEVHSTFDGTYFDSTVDQARSAFYHYRLVLIHEGTKSEMGGVRSIYFNR